MSLVLQLSILVINILVINSSEICDCQQIDDLKGIVQQVMIEQKLESAKLRRLEARQRTVYASPGTAFTHFVDRLAKMESNIADMDKKLNALVEVSHEGKGENLHIILKKTLAAEKLERIQFISDMESQMTDMKEELETFRAETTMTIGDTFENISATEENFEQNINKKLTNIKGQTENTVKNVLSNVTTFQNDIKLDITRYVDDKANLLNQNLHKTNRKVSSLDSVVVKERINGGWAQWGDWSACSAICGNGIKHKLRTCSSPSPSVLGRQCEGNSRQTDSCLLKPCSGQRVAFTAYGIGAGKTTGNVRFPSIIENIGQHYSSTTGMFTCFIPGIYHFVLTLSIRNDYDRFACNLFKNSEEKTELYVNKHEHHSSNTYPATVAASLHLNKGDVVYVGNCEEYGLIYNDKSTVFTGFLVSADN